MQIEQHKGKARGAYKRMKKEVGGRRTETVKENGAIMKRTLQLDRLSF